ncbi:DNA ligase 1 isoform X1 [Desmodus rotundus]|uniref:DNA ligase 1 isoform X1 n=1 Tax=Desmodus rotundus TaxID=9430 RepID=UPI0023810965|nr:DNA ligase 1 isoform X1 [Desmodus rotundus]XP_053771093.1 DNA ligase 1 isoform X1 [Desmodus rotundus]XP_053771094.1 DNA ligase 1 isoform X1 [Desmodus rotundus]XP_053771096.1 DNA ligase 1 isoform X1 [Desmodus rotundus]XP_053771097.1 DNA ligase 1 isoform X1 [Desmodus rotundus]
MQRTIMSFFHPKKEGKAKKPEEASNSIRETEPPPKVALKERNRAVPESESPVKRPGRRAARVLCSDGEEEDEAIMPPKGQKPAPDSPPASPPSPVTVPESSPALSDSSPVRISPSGIPKRRTARKQLYKRTIQDVLEEHNKDKDRETKRKRAREEAETPTESLPELEGAKEKEADEGGPPRMPSEPQNTCEAEAPPESSSEPEAREEDRVKPPARAPKTLSSFFTPRKPATKNEVKEVGPGTPRKEEPKGPSHLDVSSSPPDPGSYNPAKSSYHPMHDACWKQGQKVPYLAVARTFEKIEEVSARLRMVETLSNLLRSVVALSPPDLLPILYLSLNCLGPPQQGLELGVGDGVLLKAVAQATGRQLESVRAEAAEKGDVGLVAENSRSTQRLMLPPPALTASGVFARFRDIARLTGSASTAKKIEIIKGLFVACRHSEARFIARALSGQLRLGLAEQSVLAALAQAVSLTPPGQEFPPAVVDAGKGKTAEARKTWLEEQGMVLKQTFCEVPDLDRIVPVLLEHGLERLPEHCRLSPGIPLKPMLAHPTRGVSEVLKRFEEAAFTCEYKYDGQRAQIHFLEGGEVKIFSRNQEDNTGKYPDIISRTPKVPFHFQIKLPSVTSFILDAEAVAWDREKKQIQPFQVLTTRKRKEVDAAEIQVQVCLYAFDLIYLNGESLVREPLSRRRQLLRENFVETEGEFVFATSLDTKDMDQIAEFLEQSVKDSCEGLMVKTLDVHATYEIAKRSHNWLKLKKDYLNGLGDTLDLVVIGAYLGRGRRAGRYGGFLLACYDEDSEGLQAICKLGTGFSDEELEEHHRNLQALVLPTPRSYVQADGAVAPDHWLEPRMVWEVKCADLSLSPIYPAARGLVDSEKGISLRFPRFIRVREDKKPEAATTSAQVACLYRKQSQIQNQQGADADSDREDFY